MRFAEQTIDEFLENVASATVTPSGGAVAAMSGAAGAALCEMVCIHTIGKEGYADVEREITGVRDELGVHRTRLLDLADEDAAAVDELQAAFETSGDDGHDGHDEHDETIQEAARRAAEVPLETARECLAILEHAAAVTEKGNRNAVADAGTGAFLAYGALGASVMTARLNVGLIENTTVVAEIETRSTEIDDAGEAAFERVKTNVSDAV